MRVSDDRSISLGMRLSDGCNYDVLVQDVSDRGYGVIAIGPDRRNEESATALKSLHWSLLKRPTIYERFISECLLQIGLWPHPNIVGVYGVTTMGDARIAQRPFIALQHAKQGSLRDWLKPGYLTRETALTWAQCIAAGLTYLHEPKPAHLRRTPIVHGNLKPENVLIEASGVAVLTDFGLANAIATSARTEDLLPFIDENAAQTATQALQTAAGVTLGTPAYMAPEQWLSNRDVREPADIYALGVVLYELFAGRHPLLEQGQRQRQQAWQRAHATHDPLLLRAVDPSLPAELEALALACLAKEANRRPSARDVWERLQGVARSLGMLVWEAEEVAAPSRYSELAHWSNWSNSYACFERWEEALERNDRALQLAPRAVPTLRDRGEILVGLRRYDDAEAVYKLALQYANTDNERGMVWGQLGTMHNEAGHDALAAMDY